MLALPRRWLRQLSYAGILLVFASFLLLVANKKRFIRLQDYIDVDYMPQYFQPPSDAYIVDLAIGSCADYNKLLKKPHCGLPSDKEGKHGDLGSSGGWIRVNKNLLLGSSWVWASYLLVKEIQPEYHEKHGDTVVVDVWVANPEEDCRVKGNKKCIPKKILEEIHKTRVFDDEDLAQLQEQTKDIKGQVENGEGKPAPEELEKMYEPKGGNEGASESDEDDEEKTKEKEEEQEQEEEEKEEKKEKEKEGKKKENHSKDEENKEEKSKRDKESSRHDLEGYLLIPSQKKLDESGWKKLSHGVWVKYGPATENAVTGIDVLFGPDAVDPRPNWDLLPHPLKDIGGPAGMEPRLTIRYGRRLNYKSKEYQPPLKFSSEGTFKILQVADLHFSTGVGKCRDAVPASSAKGCEADPRTLHFINEVLDIEKPDFVVMTGDQVFGQAAPDPETALFKAVSPFVQRKIPFAITLGNHDDESVLSREQMMKLASSLPYSHASVGPQEVDGFGNYALTVESSKLKKAGAALYFLDSHSYSKQPKTNPGYDWFKDSQITWLELESAGLQEEAGAPKGLLLSMAFFHIPIPEFRETADRPFIGQMREGVAGPKYHVDIRAAFGIAGIHVASVGHDHANDYCLLNEQDRETEYHHKMWLCYGGGAGEGGYGGYDGYIRRVRVYELNQESREVRTWKRAENNPGEMFDRQVIVKDGETLGSVKEF